MRLGRWSQCAWLAGGGGLLCVWLLQHQIGYQGSNERAAVHRDGSTASVRERIGDDGANMAASPVGQEELRRSRKVTLSCSRKVVQGDVGKSGGFKVRRGG